MAHILVVEDEEILGKNISAALRYEHHEVTLAPHGEGAIDAIADHLPDLILLDVRLPGIDGLSVLRQVRKEGFRLPILIMTAHGNIETAVEAMKAGADDFVSKPLDLKELQITVAKLLDQQKVRDQLEYYHGRECGEGGVATLLGESAAMEAIREKVRRLAHSPAMKSAFPPSVLITGETGTGKDLLARAIHFEGPRAGKPFIHVNCTAIPAELFESELFGHVKGAFTSAIDNRKGLMELADGGTIFFDEVGHMRLDLQSKLLTALEHKLIRPVGGRKEKQIDVHVVAATNRDLQAAIEEKEYRTDLYHRLRVMPIEVPPLRDRSDDVVLLAKYFLQLYRNRFGGIVEGFSKEAIQTMLDYDWPGNVRELSHVVESAVLMSDQKLIGPEQLNLSIPRGRPKDVAVDVPGTLTLRLDFEKGQAVLKELEEAVIRAALEYSGHNLSRAARVLGITRDAVRYRMRKFDGGLVEDEDLTEKDSSVADS